MIHHGTDLSRAVTDAFPPASAALRHGSQMIAIGLEGRALTERSVYLRGSERPGAVDDSLRHAGGLERSQFVTRDIREGPV